MRKFKALKKRRAPKPAAPTGPVLAFAAELKKLLHLTQLLVEQRLLPRLPALLGERLDANVTRIDAPRSINRILDQISTAVFKTWPQERMETLSAKIARLTSSHQREQLLKQVKALTGVELLKNIDRGLKAQVLQFTAENVALIKTLPQSYLDTIEKQVLNGARLGLRSEEVAAQMRERFQITERKARTIARDQVLKFASDLNATRQQNLGLEKYIWRTSGDNRVREIHAERDGNTYTWSDPPGDASDPGDGANPGEGIACFPADQRISTSSLILKAYRRGFTGYLTALVSEDGEVVRCTPNHPILTLRGWVAAQLVNVGDHVLKTRLESSQVAVENEQNADADAVEVFRAAQLIGITQFRDPVFARFHGDVSDQEVEIVNVDGRLLLEHHSPSFQELCEQVLSRAYDPAFSLGGAAPLFGGSLSTPSCSIRGACQILSFLSGERLVPNEHGLTVASRLNACLDELSSNYLAADVEMLRGLLDAASCSVEGVKLLARKLYAVGRSVGSSLRREPVSAKGFAEAVRVHTEQNGSLSESVLAHQFVRVIEKSSSEFSGHVFNLETEGNWFYAGAAVVHNCRCWAEPFFDENA